MTSDSRPLHSERVSTDGATSNGPQVKSVSRAVDILEYLAQNGWSGVTDVGNALGVHKSTAFRVLSTLESRGLIEQHADSGKYNLGFGLVHLARAVTVGQDLTRRAQPACQRLAEEAGETVTLAVLEGDAVVTIDQIIPDSSVVSRSWLGRRTPLHATSHGKVFLAYLPQSRRDGILQGPHEVFTQRTIVEPVALREELLTVQELGYATCQEELEEGLDSAAAPIHGADGTVIAVVSVSGPSYRITRERLQELGTMARATATEISQRFGYSRAEAGGVRP